MLRLVDDRRDAYVSAMALRLTETDIVVVGAGAAGLAAGRDLRRAGASFVILEARDRLGGRAWTVDRGGWPIDLGCGWLHSADENPFVGVAEERGVALDRSAAAWEKPAWNGNFSDADQARFREGWQAFYERLEAGAQDEPDRPASDFLEPGSPWNALIDAGSTYINGAELPRVSTQDFHRYRDTEINWRTPGGYGALIAGLGDDLPIERDCAVVAIDHAGKRLRIETAKGSLDARAAIVTVSTNLLAAQAIRFAPALPNKVEAAANLPLGLADKTFLAVEGAQDLPAETRLYGARDRVGMASYHLRPFGRPLIECYFGGAFAHDLERAGESAFADYAIADIASALGSQWRARLTPLAASRWSLDPLARGSYSRARVGHADARATLAAPVDGRLFFAGEATSRADFSTAHGAYRSGLAAARAAAERVASRRATAS